MTGGPLATGPSTAGLQLSTSPPGLDRLEAAVAFGPLPAAPVPPHLGSVPVHVRGGVGGVVARLDDMDAAARVLAVVAVDLDAVLHDVGAVVGRTDRAAGWLFDPLGAAEVSARVAWACDDHPSSLRKVHEAVHDLAVSLRRTAELYRHVDQVVSDWPQVLAIGAADAASLVVGQASGPLALELLERSLPRLMALAPDEGGGGQEDHGGSGAGLSLLARAFNSPDSEFLVAALAAWTGPFGTGSMRSLAAGLLDAAGSEGLLGSTSAAVTPVPVAPVLNASAPPTGVGDLLRRSQVLSERSERAPGEVLVQRIRRPGRPDSVVVYVPATQEWSPGGRNPFDGQSNAEDLAGRRSAASSAIVAAMRAAGVRPGEPVMLVGHSQGGMTAAHLASDPAFRAEFDVRGVLVAGSPVAADAVPAEVPMLALEHADDGVPHLDGADNADTPSITTVTAPTPAGHKPHDVAGYVTTGEQVDASTDASVRAWRQAMEPFLGPGACVDEGRTAQGSSFAAQRVEVAPGR